MKIFIDPVVEGKKLYEYVFRLIAANKGITVSFIDTVGTSDLTAGYLNSNLIISPDFYRNLNNENYNHEIHFKDSCIIRNDRGEEDILSTIFYCVNSIQEYHFVSDDPFGRFKYVDSYQKKFDNITVNYVQKLIDRIFMMKPELNSQSRKAEPSSVFLTHDIDTVYGAVKEDGLAALKKGRFAKMFSLAMNAVLNKPDWINFDRIMDIESEYGFRSVFYWLLKKDKMNADYNYSGSELQPAVRKVAERGWESGLHKSLRPLTLNEESTEIENYTGGNRYHYLNFTLPSGYDELDKSTVLLDTSLGFTEQYGFRNNYGRPFIPYNLKEDSLYNFVEVPMNIMDRTFFRERMDVKDVYSLLINWFEKNNADCVFTINFHNNFFSGLKYDGYTWLYKSLLTYFRDSGWKGISQAQLIDTYYRQSKQIES